MTEQSDREYIAARWLIEQGDPAFSETQRVDLAHWLVASLDNCMSYLKVAHAWSGTALLKRGPLPVPYGTRPFTPEKIEVAERKRLLADVNEPAIANRAFGQVVRDHRRARRWSQEMLARRTRLSRAYVSRLERGLVSPTFTVIVRIARAVDMMPSALLLDFEQVLRKISKERTKGS